MTLLEYKTIMGEYKVLITTSGVGSRLGELTKYTNKSLVRVGKKPAISYIVEAYPKNVELVITLGYYGDHVRNFLELAYPERTFTFVYVPNYENEGSSLGLSMLQAKDHLQCPFIFHASDTIILEDIKSPMESNWVGVSYKEDCSQYRTIKSDGGFRINDKGELGSTSAYVGLAGIKDYEIFWDSLEFVYNENPVDASLSDCQAINLMSKLNKFKIEEFENWLDIGNSFELENARENIYDKFEILDKVDESIFIFKSFVIKFFHNKETCENRVVRARILDGLTPEILGVRDNFYKYDYVEGDLLADVVNEKIFKELLEWSGENLWKELKRDASFIKVCERFYIDKSVERINKFLTHHNMIDEESIINGVKIPTVMSMIKTVKDCGLLNTSNPHIFHGDMVLENIIYNDGKFTLIDWRQDFGGELANADIMYDFAKLNHNLIFNHAIVHKKLYTFNRNESNEITCDILCSKNLIECQKILHNFIENKNYNLNTVKILTPIIWLNMAALHDDNLGQFLFHFGKLNLYKALNNAQIKS